MIDEYFINQIPENFLEGTTFIIESFFDFINKDSKIEPDNETYLEYIMLIQAYLDSKSYTYDKLVLGGTESQDRNDILEFYFRLQKEFAGKIKDQFIENTQDRFNGYFNNTFTYEFSEGDLTIIQKLINELRELLISSELFTADHKRRLLKRLEKLQSELHKKVSDLDRFWGLIGDAGVVIGKFGQDAKPFVDRIKEIADIIWRTQARSEELPSGSHIPFLKNEENKDNS